MPAIPLPEIKSIPGLAELPEPFQELISQGDALISANPGESIIGQERANEDVLLVVSGHASVVLRDPHLANITVDTLAPGDLFGEIPFFTGVPWISDSDLVAEESCRVLRIPALIFQRVLREDGEFSVRVTKRLVRKIMLLNRSILRGKLRRNSLHEVISRQEHLFPDRVIGEHVRKRLADRIRQHARSGAPILIMGETGVGKEVIAHEIYRQSHHGKEVFLQVDLLENQRNLPLLKNRLKEEALGDVDPVNAQMELFFGVEEADSGGGTIETPGYFELADGGTLLVRGVDRLAPRVQMELLEAVTTESFRRRGGLMLRKAKVRLIATTRLDSSAVALETLPLLFALQKFAITIPPLRKRLREIPSLAKHYLNRYSQQLQRPVRVIPDESMKVLVSYPWPGNDFELANTLKRAVLVSQGAELKPRDLSLDPGRVEGRKRYNLMKFRAVRSLWSSPLFPMALQAGMLALFVLFVAGLFHGHPETRHNPYALFGWAFAWPLFIIIALVAARFWCAVCPVRTIAELCKIILALERPLPRFIRDRGDFIIAASVVVIIWVEAVTSMRGTPYHLGMLLVSLVLSAVLVTVIYERNAWCGYLCGLGGIAGTFAKSSILELRMDRNVCSSQCTSNACCSGTPSEPGCVTGKAGPRLRSNRSCMLCGSCVKNCPHGAVNVNLRLPGAEIWEESPVGKETAFLVLAILGGLMGELMAGTTLYEEVRRALGVQEKVFLTGVFLATLLALTLTCLGASTISAMVYRESTMENFRRFAIGFLPLAIMGFLAFHSYYLVSFGGPLLESLPGILPVEMDRSAAFPVPPRVTELIQQCLTGLGMLWSAVCLVKIARQPVSRHAGRWAGCLPHVCVMCLAGLALLQCMAGAR